MSTRVQSSALPSLRVLASPTTYKDLDDYDLVLACQHQDESAFNELYKRYVRHVRSSLNRVAPDWFNIHDDLVQECFLRVWKHSHTIKNPRAFKRWLDQMVSNLVYDHMRRRPKCPIVSIDEPLWNDSDVESSSRDIPDTRHQPDEHFERQETLDAIQAALELLPKQFKNVIVLREFHGLSYEEIAARTHTEIGTVKSRIARAKTKMQSRLRRPTCA